MAMRRLAQFFVATLAFVTGENIVAQQSEAQVRVSFLVGSDYIHNGLSLTDSKSSARLLADYQHPSGFFVGGFMSNVEFSAEERFRKSREYEANLYAGYAWRKGKWATNVSLARYLYPDLIISYDYTQAAVNVSFDDRYFFNATRSTDYLAILQDSYQYRVGIALPTVLDLEVGLNAGEFRSSGFFDTSYSFWDIGVSRALGRFALDLRYHDNTSDRASLIGDPGTDRWVFSAAIAIIPRLRQ